MGSMMLVILETLNVTLASLGKRKLMVDTQMGFGTLMPIKQ
jgi:hypothetical protein